MEQQKQRQRGGDDGEAEGITKKFDHRSENWMKFDTFSSFWNIIQTPAASAGPAAVGRRVFFTLLL